MATLGIDVGGILLTWPIHLDFLFFTSNEMGSIPVRSWNSALVILFGQEMCRIFMMVTILQGIPQCRNIHQRDSLWMLSKTFSKSMKFT